MKVLISESTYKNLNRIMVSENYDMEKLYHRESLVKRLLAKNSKGFYIAPKPIRDVVERLPYIECEDSQGNKTTCTKIPEVVFVYLTGRY
jgi:hypothetical protein